MRSGLAVILFLFFWPPTTEAQLDSLDWWISSLIHLDSITVTAQRDGFQLEEFIRIVREDDSFYDAFEQLRLTNYLSEQEMEFFDKKGKRIARHQSLTRQTVQDSCRSMVFLEQTNSGRMLKGEEFRFYTAKMLDHIFYTHGTVCPTPPGLEPKKESKMDKHQGELKKLIFSPGSEVEVPFIGRKTAIFSEKQYQYYDYTVETDTLVGQTPCYHFHAQIKPEYLDRKESKTIVKEMDTWFSKEDFQVLRRDYQLFYQGLFRFDVRMHIDLVQTPEAYLPRKIRYEGVWKIPGKKPEKGWFELRFLEFSPME